MADFWNDHKQQFVNLPFARLFYYTYYWKAAAILGNDFKMKLRQSAIKHFSVLENLENG